MGTKTFDPKFIFKETQYDVGQSFKGFPYQETKFIAEGLVRKAKEDGLVWNIFRPGQIFGESQEGRYPLGGQTNVGGLFYDIFRSNLMSQSCMDTPWKFDVTPVNYVAKALIYLGLKEGSTFNTYHLTNPHIQSYSKTINLFCKLGYNINFYPVEEYFERLSTNQMKYHGRTYRSPTLKTFMAWRRGGMFNFMDSAVTDSSLAQSKLIPAGIKCPKIDENLIETYLNYGLKIGFFPTPEDINTEDDALTLSASRKRQPSAAI